jgi:6-pyruvoyltetrahydropterin/6-carboxytetrahydropterin synthase
MGHRVYGHESKCSNLHGHNYKFLFTVKPKQCLDGVGRVTDFSEVKNVLCEWLEKNWDHKTILWDKDPLAMEFEHIFPHEDLVIETVHVPFNPTAENIANYFLTVIASGLTKTTGWYLYSLTLFETSKCSATVTLTKEQEILKTQENPIVKMPEGYYCSKQCGNERNCRCGEKDDFFKINNCLHCYQDLPF